MVGAEVVGVEPSAGMRAEARRVLPPPAPQASMPAARDESPAAARREPRTAAPHTSGGRVVGCVGGVAEGLPLRDASVDVAWLSTIVHHIGDLDRAVAELRRVLRPGGHVLVRGYFAGLPLGRQLRRFPGIERAAASFPTRTAVVETFRRGGFGAPALSAVRESWEADVGTVVRRACEMRRVDTLLCRLTDDEFEAGLRAISEQASGDSRVTVDGILDFYTFRAP
ncbi:MAG TPA: class I SAM-dependent methyltransferase [Acidimicrobiales bacterium]